MRETQATGNSLAAQNECKEHMTKLPDVQHSTADSEPLSAFQKQASLWELPLFLLMGLLLGALAPLFMGAAA